MFKGKKSLYILIPINILVWGFIAYKIYAALNEENESIPQDFYLSKSKLEKEDSIKYKLSLNYIDPFLKEEPKNRNLNKPISTPSNNSNIVKNNAIPAKTNVIKYLGLVQNNSSGIATGLISINGETFVIKKGEMVEGILIKSLDEKKLIARDGKISIIVKRD